MIKKYALVLFVLLTSCDLIDYHPYDGRITYKEDKDINEMNIFKIRNACQDKDTIRLSLQATLSAGWMKRMTL